MRLAPRAGPSLLLLAAAAGCASAGGSGITRTFAGSPDLTVRETRTHYDVGGTRADAIGTSLSDNAPRKDGRPAYGLTRWTLSWRFDVRRSAGTCRVVSPRVTADLEVVLPRWATGAPADAPLVSRWEEFREAVREHEEGHRRLMLEAGREIARRLRRTQGPRCRLVRYRADRAAREIVEDYDRRNRAYDEQTRGGRTQGVRWP